MRLAFWTAEPQRWSPALPDASGSLLVVAEKPAVRPAADLDVYHLRDDPRFGFVLQALAARPGVVVLEQWSLHALVHAETAGRGDERGYLLAARRFGGARGQFIARQVLRGLGGALAPLLALNDVALDAALAVISPDTGGLAGRLGGRPLLPLSLQADGPEAIVAAVSSLAIELAPLRPAREALLAATRAAEATLEGRCLAELRPLAREVGLPELPESARRALVPLLSRGA